MKYERTDPFKSKDDFEKLIEEAVSEAEDSEAEEFLSQLCPSCSTLTAAEPLGVLWRDLSGRASRC